MGTVILKPCPWCGSPARLDSDGHYVECSGEKYEQSGVVCPVMPKTWDYDTDEEAIMNWNLMR